MTPNLVFQGTVVPASKVCLPLDRDLNKHKRALRVAGRGGWDEGKGGEVYK
jgi:hypothetical protein